MSRRTRGYLRNKFTLEEILKLIDSVDVKLDERDYNVEEWEDYFTAKGYQEVCETLRMLFKRKSIPNSDRDLSSVKEDLVEKLDPVTWEHELTQDEWTEMASKHEDYMKGFEDGLERAQEIVKNVGES